MSDLVTLTGMVLSTMPIGDYDRRLLLLTKERGKISAFAKGARRPNSALMAASRPFIFGKFTLYEGRTSYTVRNAEISNYFEALTTDMEGFCYASYFAELIDYYTRENMESTELLKLFYQTLRALSKESLPNPLVRRVFELKTMVINGEYSEKLPFEVNEATLYTMEFIITTSVERLYTFTVVPEILSELSRCVDYFMKQYIDKAFHSLEVLETLV